MTPFSFCSKQKKFILTRINIVEYYSILFNLYFIQKLSSYNSNLSKKQNKKAKTNLKKISYLKKGPSSLSIQINLNPKFLIYKFEPTPLCWIKKKLSFSVMKNPKWMNFFIFILISFQTKKNRKFLVFRLFIKK